MLLKKDTQIENMLLKKDTQIENMLLRWIRN